MTTKGNSATRKRDKPKHVAALDDLPGVAEGTAERTQQLAVVDRAFLDRAELRRGLTENLRALRTDATVVTDRVNTAFDGWNPGGLSTDELDRRNFVPPDADPTEAVHRVIDRHVAALKDAPSRARMTIRKRGSSGSLVENADGTDGGTGTIKLGPLVEFLAERTDALLSTEATAIATCKAQSEAAGILAEIDATAPKESGGGTTTTEDSLVDIERVAEFVEHAVQRQMRSATAPEDQPVFAPIPTGERTDTAQAALLETFELRPGASDVPSYHEFNTLQIAFEHVWTQIFDGEIESIGRELYKEYVGLKDFLGYDAPDTTITTVDDLRRLMGEIKELSQSAQTDLPSDLGGNPTPDEKPKSAGDLENAKKTGAIVGGIVTGGLIALVAWAVDEISRAGQKPVLHWADVNGGALARGDRITANVQQGVAPRGLVEFTLLTDVRSHRKLLAFQTYVEQAAKFVNVAVVANTAGAGATVVTQDGTQYYADSATFQAASIPIGVFEFASQETETIDLGRYVLAGLGERLQEGSRVTFTWLDS